MSFSADSFLLEMLEKRRTQNAFRKLVDNSHLADFCSNDYLGFARSSQLYLNIEKELKQQKSTSVNRAFNGSTGSRLLAGNNSYTEKLERKIASFHNAETGLIYNSGYDANVGLFSAIGHKNATIIYDELIHASVHDGMKQSNATTIKFKHNDTEHLENKLKETTGLVFVVIESIYSMDGDASPLSDIAKLCSIYHANLIVDEAHATGVTTNLGKGLVNQLNIENLVFARIHTFGKAIGCHGAIILGSYILRNFLINFSRAFIYTTALPLHSLIAIHQAYQLLETDKVLIQQLHSNIDFFRSQLTPSTKEQLINSNSPIQCLICSGNQNVKQLAYQLQQNGFDIRAILSPTVPRNKERVRICIHAFNTLSEIEQLCFKINHFFAN